MKIKQPKDFFEVHTLQQENQQLVICFRTISILGSHKDFFVLNSAYRNTAEPQTSYILCFKHRKAETEFICPGLEDCIKIYYSSPPPPQYKETHLLISISNIVKFQL